MVIVWFFITQKKGRHFFQNSALSQSLSNVSQQCCLMLLVHYNHYDVLPISKREVFSPKSVGHYNSQKMVSTLFWFLFHFILSKKAEQQSGRCSRRQMSGETEKLSALPALQPSQPNLPVVEVRPLSNLRQLKKSLTCAPLHDFSAKHYALCCSKVPPTKVRE